MITNAANPQLMELALSMARNVLLADGFEAKMAAVCTEIQRHFDLNRIAVFLINDAKDRIEGRAGLGLFPGYIRSEDYPLVDEEGAELYRAIPRAALRNETIVCRDRSDDRKYRLWAEGKSPGKAYAKEYAIIPLPGPHGAIGVITISVMEHGRLPDEMIAAVEKFAGVASLAILEAGNEARAREAYINVLSSLSNIIENRDSYTAMHIENVTAYATSLARKLGLDHEAIEGIRVGALLHDVGKVAITDLILNKPAKLTKSEYETMKHHSVIGGDILLDAGFLAVARKAVRHHHERWDGEGYPDGLTGDTIPIEAQIIAIADAYDAMTTDRPYRAAMEPENAIRELRTHAGSQFNPELVTIFIGMLNDDLYQSDSEVKLLAKANPIKLAVIGEVNLQSGKQVFELARQQLHGDNAMVILDLLTTDNMLSGGLWYVFRLAARAHAYGGILVIVAGRDLHEELITAAEGIFFRIVLSQKQAYGLLKSYQ